MKFIIFTFFMISISIVCSFNSQAEPKSADIFAHFSETARFTLYIQFDTGKAVLKPQYDTVVQQITTMLNNNSSLSLIIEGHTDNKGGKDYNKKLSFLRAMSVLNAIVLQGINPNRLTAVGYGDEKPVGDNSTEEGRSKNRRIEILKR